MDSDASVIGSAQDTTPASPGTQGPPRTFLGATAVVGAGASIVSLLLVASGSSFWSAIAIPVIIIAGLILALMHVFAVIGRSSVGKFVVGGGYAAAGVATLMAAAANGTAVFPGPAVLAAVAFIAAALTLLGATRAYLRAQRPSTG